MSSQSGAEKFQFLVKLALDNGAADAKIIPANNAGIQVSFPFAKNPESFALLLID
jgi:hypothetical protein